ncbi:hypothetical protein P9139_06020 [Curtobacterium flaccumfaciens]|nr:hypothetical protein P9139_06020 [Curtobacterium flaccumfaciens]
MRDHLVDQVEVLRDEPGEREERTGLHETEFIEVRRHWFDRASERDARGTVHVLNLVEGDEVEVISPDGTFPPYVVHYAETFVVPAAVGRYVVRPGAAARSERFATVQASVRGTTRDARAASDATMEPRSSTFVGIEIN